LSINSPEKEIIEFPVVVVNVDKKEIEHVFHYYIKPVVHPNLFPFCTELTGIQQHQVDNGLLLEDAIVKLDEFLKEKVKHLGIRKVIKLGNLTTELGLCYMWGLGFKKLFN
jgi:inhibitor of KinA sporulation pathway (predicted exonuclease)